MGRLSIWEVNHAGSARDTALGVLPEVSNARICTAPDRWIVRYVFIGNAVKEQVQTRVHSHAVWR